MNLRFTPRATADLSDIVEYFRSHNPIAAVRVRASIYRSLQNLVQFPQLGRRQRTAGVRKLVTAQYRYLIYYKIDEGKDEIVILSINHPARRRLYSDL